MSRESIDAKARRYLGEARVRIRIVDRDHVEADVLGADSAIYETTHNGRGWRCSCPARRQCAHIRALQLLVSFRESR